MFDVRPGTILVYSDVGCPWAHLAVYRLREARRRLGLLDSVVLDHRAFPLELVNARPTPKRILDAEVPVAGALEPAAGWQMWQSRPEDYPVTTLPALEAVQAAKEQGLHASERLDGALRVAFFGQSRCISMRHVILAVAGECGIDERALAGALDDGRARGAVTEQLHAAQGERVKGSPHVFLPDGRDVHNPGVGLRWEGKHGVGFPVVTRNEPALYDALVRRAAEAA